MQSQLVKLSSSSSILLFAVSVLVVFCSTEAVIKLPGNNTVPAVIVFGDSIVDTGNNNNLKTPAKCNFPPYGRDFMGGVPTGRFSNGKVPPDLIVEELGIKDYLPAYLEPTLKPGDLLTGVCFASGGCGYDPLTSKLALAISLSDQLQLFKEYAKKLKGIVGEETTNTILKTALFVVVASSNDIANTYFGLPIRKLRYDVPAYANLLVGFASDFLKELYGLGARRIAVFGAPPIGCVPSERTLAGGADRDCAYNYNHAAELFNQKLSAKLDSFTSSLPNSRIVYIDVYSPLLDLIQNPKKYGFEVVNKGCCGTGNIEVAFLCNKLTSTTCRNVSTYIFWDSYHPTERAYKILLSSIVGKYINKFL